MHGMHVRKLIISITEPGFAIGERFRHIERVSKCEPRSSSTSEVVWSAALSDAEFVTTTGLTAPRAPLKIKTAATQIAFMLAWRSALSLGLT